MGCATERTGGSVVNEGTRLFLGCESSISGLILIKSCKKRIGLVNRVKYVIELLHKICIVRENLVGHDAIGENSEI